MYHTILNGIFRREVEINGCLTAIAVLPVAGTCLIDRSARISLCQKQARKPLRLNKAAKPNQRSRVLASGRYDDVPRYAILVPW